MGVGGLSILSPPELKVDQAQHLVVNPLSPTVYSMPVLAFSLTRKTSVWTGHGRKGRRLNAPFLVFMKSYDTITASGYGLVWTLCE
jgi:hypothetical protein